MERQIWLKAGKKKRMDLKFNIFIKKMVECILHIIRLTKIFVQN